MVKRLSTYILTTIAFIETLLIILGVSIIDDLKATAKGYESDRNVCKLELDSITNDYERIQIELEEK